MPLHIGCPARTFTLLGFNGWHCARPRFLRRRPVFHPLRILDWRDTTRFQKVRALLPDILPSPIPQDCPLVLCMGYFVRGNIGLGRTFHFTDSILDILSLLAELLLPSS